MSWYVSSNGQTIGSGDELKVIALIQGQAAPARLHLCSRLAAVDTLTARLRSRRHPRCTLCARTEPLQLSTQ